MLVKSTTPANFPLGFTAHCHEDNELLADYSIFGLDIEDDAGTDEVSWGSSRSTSQYIDPALLSSPSNLSDSSFLALSTTERSQWHQNTADLTRPPQISFEELDVGPPVSDLLFSHWTLPDTKSPSEATSPGPKTASLLPEPSPTTEASQSLHPALTETLLQTTSVVADPPSHPQPSEQLLPAGKPKAKRGRKPKVLSPDARDAQHLRTLARNRAAAQRCRLRKKGQQAGLEIQARVATKEQARLRALVSGLQEELLSLKGTMLHHADCDIMEEFRAIGKSRVNSIASARPLSKSMASQRKSAYAKKIVSEKTSCVVTESI